MEKIIWPLFAKPIFKRPVDISGLDLSSVGRAARLHRVGRQFETVRTHQVLEGWPSG